MWNVSFFIDASANLTFQRHTAARDLLSNVLDHFGPEQKFALVTFSENPAGYQDGTFLPASEKEAALAWFERVNASGQAQFGTLLSRIVELRDPTLLVVLSYGPLGQVDQLQAMARRAPEHLFFVGIAVDRDDSLLQAVGEHFIGGACWLQDRPPYMSRALQRILQCLRTVPAEALRGPLWELKHQLDLCLGPNAVREKPFPQAVEALERAAWISGFRDQEAMAKVVSALHRGRAGPAYAWFGEALARLEEMVDSPSSLEQELEQLNAPRSWSLPKPSRFQDFIRDMESDLRRMDEKMNWNLEHWLDAGLRLDEVAGRWQLSLKLDAGSETIELIGSLPEECFSEWKGTFATCSKMANSTRRSQYGVGGRSYAILD
jgi:hypothetical protein